MITQEPQCVYCEGPSVKKYQGLSHPIWGKMPAIDMFQCKGCGSLTTFPMPSPELLSFCYSNYYGNNGYPEAKHEAKTASNQNVWYKDILTIFKEPNLNGKIVADIGAGEGYLVREMFAATKPAKVVAFDYHNKPDTLKGVSPRLDWVSVDLSSSNWGCESQFDVVFCVSVIEHVISPFDLIRALHRICKPGGSIHLLGPLANTLAHRLLGKYWPYIIPGEHLSVPTSFGLKKLVTRSGMCPVFVRSIPVSYSLKYVIAALLKVNVPSTFDFVLRLPTGAFALTCAKVF